MAATGGATPMVRVYVAAVGGSSSASDLERELFEVRGRRATPARWRQIALSAGVLAVATAVLTTVSLVSAPRPDATLQQTAIEADGRVLSLVRFEQPWLEIDGSTLRAYGAFLGVQLWAAQDAFGSPCLIAMERSKGMIADVRCAPPPADLFVDVSSDGESSDGHTRKGIVRFFLRGDAVDAYIYALPEAG